MSFNNWIQPTFDKCTTGGLCSLVEIDRYLLWTGSTSSELPPPNTPIQVREQCCVCGKTRTRTIFNNEPK